MPKYARYNDDGSIICFGCCSREKFNRNKANGVNVIEVNSLSRKMDLTHKVKDPKSDAPQVIKRE